MHILIRFFRKYKAYTTLAFALLFFVAIQYTISQYVTLDTVYHYRINYKIFQEDPRTLEVAVDQIARTIREKKLEDYIIMIGNSVAWGTNAASDNSLNKYLNDLSTADPEHKQVVFNLSLPSMQAGDAYTLLLMLDKKNIKRDNVIIGLIYTAFIDRTNGPRAVFWTGDQLRELDKDTYNRVKEQLIRGYYKPKSGWDYIEYAYMERALNVLPLYRYKTIIECSREEAKKASDLLGDARPWNEKKISEEKIKSRDYLNFFNPTPFVMDNSNWGIYFMNKIIELQQDKRLLVFMAGGNSELSSKEISQPGYQENLLTINQYFEEARVDFINLQDVIPAKYFTDHVHLTKDGNQQLAEILWQMWQERGN